MKETRPPNESREDKDELETRFVPPAMEKKRRKEIDLKRGVYLVSFFVPVVAMAFSMRYQAHPPRLMCYKSSDLIFDVMAPASCILHSVGMVGMVGMGIKLIGTQRESEVGGALCFLPTHPL